MHSKDRHSNKSVAGCSRNLASPLYRPTSTFTCKGGYMFGKNRTSRHTGSRKPRGRVPFGRVPFGRFPFRRTARGRSTQPHITPRSQNKLSHWIYKPQSDGSSEHNQSCQSRQAQKNAGLPGDGTRRASRGVGPERRRQRRSSSKPVRGCPAPGKPRVSLSRGRGQTAKSFNLVERYLAGQSAMTRDDPKTIALPEPQTCITKPSDPGPIQSGMPEVESRSAGAMLGNGYSCDRCGGPASFGLGSICHPCHDITRASSKSPSQLFKTDDRAPVLFLHTDNGPSPVTDVSLNSEDLSYNKENIPPYSPEFLSGPEDRLSFFQSIFKYPSTGPSMSLNLSCTNTNIPARYSDNNRVTDNVESNAFEAGSYTADDMKSERLEEAGNVINNNSGGPTAYPAYQIGSPTLDATPSLVELAAELEGLKLLELDYGVHLELKKLE